jgi:hypothetical protein
VLLVQDVDHWWAFVNVIVKLAVHESGKFLSVFKGQLCKK